MKLIIENIVPNFEFKLIYNSEIHSFEVEPHPNYSFTSIVFDYLNIEVDHNGKLLYVWGVCPLTSANKTAEIPQKIKRATLFFKSDEILKEGVSIEFSQDWPKFINASEGWICLGNPESQGETIEFASGSVIVIEDESVKALWLKPDQWRGRGRGGD